MRVGFLVLSLLIFLFELACIYPINAKAKKRVQRPWKLREAIHRVKLVRYNGTWLSGKVLKNKRIRIKKI